jgi:phosphoribosylaminoimidazole-succinocarboxamide synthase
MICRAARVVQVECVARGYLAGSGWQEYQSNGTACGIALPAGLRQCEQLPEPIFTPATKAAEGHDENISFTAMCDTVGGELAERLRTMTLNIYTAAAARARARGLILADTKFEFGFALDANNEPTAELMLVDEVLTPDSSRFWSRSAWVRGDRKDSYDKQIVRNWLAENWDQAEGSTPPALPASVVTQTADKYQELIDRLTLEVE